MSNTVERQGPDLRDYVGIVWRRKWIIVACVVVAGLAAGLWSAMQTPMYRAGTDVLITQPASIANLTGSARNTPVSAAADVRLAQGAAVQAATRAVIGSEPQLRVSSSSDGSALTFSAVSSDATRSAEAADAYAQAFIDERIASQLAEYEATSAVVQQRLAEVNAEMATIETERVDALYGVVDQGERTRINSEIQSRLDPLETRKQRYEDLLDTLATSAGLAQGGSAQVIDPAQVPAAPFSPMTVRYVGLAVILGLIAGLGLAFLREYLDTTVSDEADLTVATGGLAIMATIPRVAAPKGAANVGIVSLDQPISEAAEAYRRLRTGVQFLGIDSPLTLVQVTSPVVGDGKSTTAANLAVAAARAGQRVLLIDADLRRPRLHEYFGVSATQGFTSVLLGEVTMAEVALRIGAAPSLAFVPCGPIPPDPSELLASKRAAEVLESLRGSVDLVIIDTPPVLAVSDPLVVSRLVDGVLLVASAGCTDSRQVAKALGQLQQVDAPVLGTVLNRLTVKHGRGYGYGYGYGPGSAYTGPAPTTPRVDDWPETARDSSSSASPIVRS